MLSRVLQGFCAAVAAAVALTLGAHAADTAAVTTVKLAQEQLHHLGFYSGLIDGRLEGDAQAALAQFQLSRNIPASGTLDDATLAALRIERQADDAALAQSGEAGAAAGGSNPD